MVTEGRRIGSDDPMSARAQRSSHDALPDDCEALKALLLAERAALAEERAETAQLTDQVSRLEAMLEALRRARFGPRAERYDPDQLQLALEDIEQAIAEGEAEQEQQDAFPKRKAKRRNNRGTLPKHVPRIEQVIEPEERSCPCCGSAMHVMGEDVSERLDVIPAQFRVLVTRRPKYACRACEGAVVQAPALAHLIEGGLPSEALVAHVLVSKYADHLPLYRQAQIYARQDIALDRSTLADWVGRAAAELKPVQARLGEIVKGSAKLFADETRAPVLDPGRKKTKTGYLWAMARDDRPWGGADPPAVADLYAPGRGAEHAATFLDGFSSILQVDGYVAYKGLAAPDRAGGPVTLAFCWAHVRRKFYDLAAGGHTPVAKEMLERIAALYRIEKDIRGLGPEARCARRQSEAGPIVTAMKPWLEAQLSKVSGRSRLAEAIRYALKLWPGLTLYIDDGRIEIDSNTVERAIRPIALNRKNALFAGSDRGGEHWGIIASLIETCKLNGVDPQAYLADTLTRLVNGHLMSRIDDLMPWAYQAKISKVG